jgi:hypothetical protein
MLLAASLILRDDTIQSRRVLNQRLDASADRDVAACASPLANHGRGYLHHANILRRLGSDAVGLLAAGRTLRDGVVERLGRLLCHAREAALRPDGLVLGVTAVGVYSDLAFAEAPPSFLESRHKLLAGWQEALERTLILAPERSDLAVPYFSWLLAGQSEAALAALANRLLRLNPDDPVGLWFSGVGLLAQPATAERGMSRMSRAIDKGLEEVMPLDDQIRAQVESWRSSNLR